MPRDPDAIAAVLAGQLGFVGQDSIKLALESPADRALLDRLHEDGLLTDDQYKILQGMVRGALQAHDGSVSQAVQTLSGNATLPAYARTLAAPGSDPDAAPGGDAFDVTPQAAGRYELGTEIGRGGQARILLAVDHHIGRQVAWKELLPDAEAGSMEPSSHGVTNSAAIRFLREARVTARLEHPNIITVHEVGRKDDGTLYYCMRLVRGTSLADKLAACTSLAERMKLLGTFWDVCNAVAYAHSKGVIHRDLKPGNIMVGEFGQTVVLDWGLAKVKGSEDTRGREILRRAERLRDARSSETVDGAAIGTPSYMSPEQARGLVDEIDERSDVWGLGAVLFEILTGRPPFDGRTVPEVLFRVAYDTPPAVQSLCPDAPMELCAITAKALQREKDVRYESAQQVSEDVSAFMTGRRVLAHEYSSWELIRRFAARNRLALGAAAAVLAVILVSLVVVLVAWRREAEARVRERNERLLAHHHLAYAYARQAESLADDNNLLGAGIFAAASLMNNPSHPRSEFYDPGFAAREPGSTWLQARAASLSARSGWRLIRRLAWTLPMKEGSYNGAWSPDGTRVASADQSGTLHLWEPRTGREVRSWQAHADRVFSVVFSPDGKRIATGGRDATIKVWDTGGAALLHSMRWQGGAVLSLAFSADGTRLVWGDDKGLVAVGPVSGDGPVMRLEPHGDQVWGVAWSKDGKYVASSSWDKLARIYDAESGAVVHTLTGHTGAIYHLAFTPDGKRLVTAGYDKTARVWDTGTGRQVLALEGSHDGLFSVAVSPDGKRIATCGIDRHIRLWDASDGKMLAAAEGHSDVVTTVVFSPDGGSLASFSQDRTARIWELASGDGLLRMHHGDWIYRVACSRDGSMVASGGMDRMVRVWDAHTGAPRAALAGHTDMIQTVWFSQDSTRIASGSADKHARLWDIASGRELLNVIGQEGGVLDVRLSPDGSLLAAAGRSKAVLLWNASTGAEVASFAEHGDWVFSTAFSPDGRLLATASGDRLVRLFDIGERKLIRTLQGHTDWAYSVVFSPDGKTLFSSGKDAVVIQWDVATGAQVRKLIGHEAWINHITLTPDGSLLSTASDDRLAGVWDTATGAPLLHYRASAAVPSACLSSDGRHLALADDDVVLVVPVDAAMTRQDPAVLLREAESAAGVRLRNFALESVR